MTITAEESTQQIYDALIKVFKDAKVPKSNDVIPKVAALMKFMLAFIDGDGDLQLHPRSNMPGKVLRLMAEVTHAMPGLLVDFTVATGNGHRSVTYTCNTVNAVRRAGLALREMIALYVKDADAACTSPGAPRQRAALF